jgi:hypothetical protein
VKRKKLTLYVRSVKTVVGTEKWGRWGHVGGPGVRGGYRILRDYKTYIKPKYGRILPEDQKQVVEMVEEFARKHGFELEVVDAAEHRTKIRVKNFPALVIDSEEKLEGDISEEQVEALLLKAA